MLVLSRKQQEKILIGKEIEVTVTHISPNKVRLGIIAPPEMGITRPDSPLAIAQASERVQSSESTNASELKTA